MHNPQGCSILAPGTEGLSALHVACYKNGHVGTLEHNFVKHNVTVYHVNGEEYGATPLDMDTVRLSALTSMAHNWHTVSR